MGGCYANILIMIIICNEDFKCIRYVVIGVTFFPQQKYIYKEWVVSAFTLSLITQFLEGT